MTCWPCSSNIARTRPHAGTGDDLVADPQRAFLDERGDDGATTLVEVRLEHVGLGRAASGWRRGPRRSRRRRRAAARRAAPRRPAPVGAETSRTIVSPPHSSGTSSCSVSCWRTRVGSASSRSTLVTATTIGTSAARAWLIASIVCGITPSSAATTRIAMSVICAPARTHRGERFVARRVDERDAPAVARRPGTRRCAG